MHLRAEAHGSPRGHTRTHGFHTAAVAVWDRRGRAPAFARRGRAGAAHWALLAHSLARATVA